MEKAKNSESAEDEEDSHEEEQHPMREEVVFEPLDTGDEPCVGICQYYRSLGQENPFEKRAEEEDEDEEEEKRKKKKKRFYNDGEENKKKKKRHQYSMPVM